MMMMNYTHTEKTLRKKERKKNCTLYKNITCVKKRWWWAIWIDGHLAIDRTHHFSIEIKKTFFSDFFPFPCFVFYTLSNIYLSIKMTSWLFFHFVFIIVTLISTCVCVCFIQWGDTRDITHWRRANNFFKSKTKKKWKKIIARLKSMKIKKKFYKTIYSKH